MGEAMNTRHSRLRRAAVLGAITIGLAMAVPTAASAATVNGTCAGGPVAPGTYLNLEVSGTCVLDAGNVTVKMNLTVDDGASLVAAFSSSSLSVRGNLVVMPGGSLFLGCEPGAFPCFDNGAIPSGHSINGKLVADGALAVVVHATAIHAGIHEVGGGSGINCSTPFPGIGFLPAYSDYEDNIVSGPVNVSSLGTCWLGMFRNHINGQVTFSNNVLADPDGNEVADNVIKGTLTCAGNVPAVQIGDSGGGPNLVTGPVTGQCLHPIGS